MVKTRSSTSFEDKLAEHQHLFKRLQKEKKMNAALRAMLKFQQTNFERRNEFIVEQRDYYKRWYDQSQTHLNSNEQYLVLYEKILQKLKQRLVDNGISPFNCEVDTVELMYEDEKGEVTKPQGFVSRLCRRVLNTSGDEETDSEPENGDDISTEEDSQMDSQIEKVNV